MNDQLSHKAKDPEIEMKAHQMQPMVVSPKYKPNENIRNEKDDIVPSAKYLCFISYASPNKDFVDDLEEALGRELERFVRDKGLFIDDKRLRGGDLLDESIPRALCKSICMIIIYSPSYFDENYTYCAREFKGMEKLEKQRLLQLSCPEQQEHGLIIPIIFRGKKHFPKEIRDKRHYYDFSNYYSCDNRISKHPKYVRTITEIAEVIHNAYLTFKDKDVFKECDKFMVPSKEEVMPWLKEAACPHAQFPGRRS
jgi:hypothetical protein